MNELRLHKLGQSLRSAFPHDRGVVERALCHFAATHDRGVLRRLAARVVLAVEDGELLLTDQEWEEVWARVIEPRLEAELKLLPEAEQVAPAEGAHGPLWLWVRRTIEAEARAIEEAFGRDARRHRASAVAAALERYFDAYAAVAASEAAPDAEAAAEALVRLLADDSVAAFFQIKTPHLDQAMRRVLFRSGHSAWAVELAEIAEAPAVEAAMAAIFGDALAAVDAHMEPALEKVCEAQESLQEIDFNDPAALVAAAEEPLAILDDAIATMRERLDSIRVAEPRGDSRLRDALAVVPAPSADRFRAMPLPSESDPRLREMLMRALFGVEELADSDETPL